MIKSPSQWVCCQLGAREHYAIPRALHTNLALETLYTDAWVTPGSPLGLFSRSWRERFHPALPAHLVRSSSSALLAFEGQVKLRRLNGWRLMMARNRWFQQQAVQALEKLRSESGQRESGIRTLFAYSYAAREILKWAKANGWRTVLGQIDAGPQEERIVANLHPQLPIRGHQWEAAPEVYWNHWREECALADKIVVNSEWSRSALTAECVPAEKLEVIPLAFELEVHADHFAREYPSEFTAQRPLEILFLGQVNLRKGIMETLETVHLLRGEPVRFCIVGPIQVAVSEAFRKDPQVTWIGPVARGMAARYYRQADVFLFPTHSDGFGLTQLEAQTWQLPVIASRHCGEVVQDGVNGIRLSEVSAPVIAEAVQSLLKNPERLRQFAAHSQVDPQFNLAALGRQLILLAE